MDRTYHNLFNQLINGFSGNDLHAFMDRASKSLRHKHRNVGHDSLSLMQMLIMFGSKYTHNQILKAWFLHKLVDGWDSGFKAAVRKNAKGYGKKESAYEAIKRMSREVARL